MANEARDFEDERERIWKKLMKVERDDKSKRQNESEFG